MKPLKKELWVSKLNYIPFPFLVLMILYVGYNDIQDVFEPILTLILFGFSPALHAIFNSSYVLYNRFLFEKLMHFVWVLLLTNLMIGYFATLYLDMVADGIAADIYQYRKQNKHFPEGLEEVYFPNKPPVKVLHNKLQFGSSYIYIKEGEKIFFMYTSYFFYDRVWDMKTEKFLNTYD
jgi:hypothetical protein